VAEAQRDRQEALAAASKAEADLASLSNAYNGLETHSFELEEQRNAARKQLGEATAAAGGGAVSPEEVELRVAQAVAAALQREREAQQQQQQLQFGSGEDVAARIAAAVEEARAAAAEETDDAMGDLLVCLGQEEAKVAALSERLSQLGEDVDAVLLAAGVGGEEEEEEEELQ